MFNRSYPMSYPILLKSLPSDSRGSISVTALSYLAKIFLPPLHRRNINTKSISYAR